MRFAQENSFAPLKRFFPLFYFLQIYDKSGALPKNELLYFFVFLPPFCHEASHGTKNAVGINFYFEQKKYFASSLAISTKISNFALAKTKSAQTGEMGEWLKPAVC